MSRLINTNFTNGLTSGLKNGTGVCEIISTCGDFFIDVLKDLLVALGDFIVVSPAVSKKNWCFLLLIIR